MRYHIISVFPKSVNSYLESSLLLRAKENGIIETFFYSLRDYTDDKHNKVDDRPYGGGPGMVLSAQPVIAAVEDALSKSDRALIIFFTPHGETFSNTMADDIRAQYTDIIFVCGHYEGVDARVKEVFKMKDVSIGSYVLTGGELPALIMIDAITRRIPGVLGDESSVEERRIAGKDSYTRPECFEYKGEEYCVPEVLKSGNHAKIDEFRKG
ncbi:MAG: tRNA (guanosine(37)-N1)-methyltransferase TrmD [Patescibacteria group bacterium UBA2103]